MDISKKENKNNINEQLAQKLNFGTAVQQKVMQLLSQVDTFKGAWKVLEQTKGSYLKELRKIATIESTGSSTRIEGATLTDKEVEQLLRSVNVKQLEQREQQEVVGYYETLEVILEGFKDIPLSKSSIHQLHTLLLKHSAKDQRHKGQFKQISNKVVANYPDGSQRTIYSPTEPLLTEPEIEQLVGWCIERLEKQDMHPLLIVAVFVYEFLSIHPYQDGNGRLSRLLTTLLLLKLDYPFIQYVSFEHVVENKKEAYYRALMDGQKDRNTGNERLSFWVVFFLESLAELTRRLEIKYATYKNLKISLNDRQQAVLQVFEKEQSAQVGDLEKLLPSYSRNTIKKDLAYLVDEGLLLKVGAGRGVRYHLKRREGQE